MFVRKKRGAPARGAKARKAASRKRRADAGAAPAAAGLEQRHLDLIGLFLIAVGVYLGFVLFFGWEGGKVGYGVETGARLPVRQGRGRIVTVLMLLVGGCCVTGTSISTLVRGDRPRPARASSSAAAAPPQTAIHAHATERRQETDAVRLRDRAPAPPT